MLNINDSFLASLLIPLYLLHLPFNESYVRHSFVTLSYLFDGQNQENYFLCRDLSNIHIKQKSKNIKIVLCILC